MQKYADIQALVQQEIAAQFPKLYDQYATKFGVAQTPLHTHNGIDSNKVSEADLVPKMAASGSITMSTNGRRYVLELTGSPTNVQFYGNAVHRTGGSIDVRAFCVGSARLGPAYFFQPLDSSTVSPSRVIGNVIQSSAFFLGVGGLSASFLTQADEGHLVSVVYPNGSTIVARATIPNPWTGPNLTTQGYGVGFLYVDVELAAGWEINGNFVIT